LDPGEAVKVGDALEAVDSAAPLRRLMRRTLTRVRVEEASTAELGTHGIGGPGSGISAPFGGLGTAELGTPRRLRGAWVKMGRQLNRWVHYASHRLIAPPASGRPAGAGGSSRRDGRLVAGGKVTRSPRKRSRQGSQNVARPPDTRLPCGNAPRRRARTPPQTTTPGVLEPRSAGHLRALASHQNA